MLELVVGVDAGCLAPTGARSTRADEQGGAEEDANGTDDRPQGLAGHERAADGTDALAEPHAADQNEEDADDHPSAHAGHRTAPVDVMPSCGTWAGAAEGPRTRPWTRRSPPA